MKYSGMPMMMLNGNVILIAVVRRAHIFEPQAPD
jgi:uncharacterized protein YdhG (YjbR/CyaY superfamily)